MRAWVIGETGQLARALKTARPSLITFERSRLNLSDPANVIPDTLSRLSAQFGAPGAVILAAAYTAVDKAEQEPDLAKAINTDAAGAVAEWCAQSGAILIHISTDYVFDGTAKSPYWTDALPAPISVYGRTKLAGENAVLKRGCAGAIIRTSWLYDAAGPNFLTAMISQDKAGNPLRVVNDQFGRPTYAGHLADAVLTAMDTLIKAPKPCKIYHVTNTGEPVSWAGFAASILPAAKITGVSSQDFKRPAARPAYSVLDSSAFEAAFNTPLPGWREGLVCALEDLKAGSSDEA